MLMFMGLMSSLYALDTGQVVCGIEKSQSVTADTTVLPTVRSDTTYVSINIQYKDTLRISGSHATKPYMKMTNVFAKLAVPSTSGGYGSNIGWDEWQRYS